MQLFVIFTLIGFTLCDPIPPDWAIRVKEGNMLFAELEPSNQEFQASVGNGYISTVVGSDTQYIAGVFNGLNSQTPSHRARIPGTSSITITNARPTGSALDLERAVFYRRSVLQSDSSVFIEQRWYAHYEFRNLLIHEIEVVTGSNDASLQLSLNSGQPSQDINFKVDVQNNITVVSGYVMIPEENNTFTQGVAVVFTTVPNEISVAAHSNMTFYFISTFATNLKYDCYGCSLSQLIQNAESYLTIALSEIPYLLTTHIESWYWQIWFSRIEIGGNLPLAQAVNSSLYYILSSLRFDWPYSPSPGGLASNGYNGHVFWDAETWMYPTIALFWPLLSQTFHFYRFERIIGAEMKAKSYNPPFSGTMFPWESAATGEEVCPTWAPTGQLEQHISGDIGFALLQYWRLTHNTTWLQYYGWPLLQGIAEFWTSRVELQNGIYVINNVIPPDEYAVGVNNSVYTNVVASMALEAAIEAGQILNVSTPPIWQTIANNIKIPFDTTQGIHPEYDGYSGGTIKQADVVLLGFPLMLDMPTEVRENDLIYYSARTDASGPAMTWGMHAVAWIELGDLENANDTFFRSYANIQPPFNVWTETPTGGTVNFITGAGGFLQAVWAGYPGLRIKDDGLYFNPLLPPNTQFIQFVNLNYMGGALNFGYDGKFITVELTSIGIANLFLTSGESVTQLEIRTPVTVPLGACKVHL